VPPDPESPDGDSSESLEQAARRAPAASATAIDWARRDVKTFRIGNG
jgi:hypothetical protein